MLALGLAACGTATGGGGGGSPSSSSEQPKQGGTLTLSYLTEPSSLDPAIAWNVIDWQIEHDIYQGFLQYAHKPGAGRHRAHPVPRHRGAQHRQRRHLSRRQDVHLPPAQGRQVPAAGEPRGHGGRLQVQLRAHDEAAARAGHVLLHGRRRRRGLPGRQGRRASPASRSSTTTPSRSRSRARTSRSSTPSPWSSATSCPRSGSRSGASSSTATRSAPARSCSTVDAGPRDRAQAQPAATGTRASPISTRSTTSSRSAHDRVAQAAARRGRRAGRRRAPADLLRVQTDPKWKAAVFTQPQVAISYLFMNVQMKPFDNVKVRQALSWAIDRDKIVKLLGRSGTALYQVYPPGHAGPRRTTRSSTGTTRPRPSNCSPTPATPTASRRSCTPTTSTPTPSSAVRAGRPRRRSA